MVPELMLADPWFRIESDEDREQVRGAFLEVFSHLLEHRAPIAQYAALHGLGHLNHPGGPAVIDQHLAAAPRTPAARQYAEWARAGDVL